MKEIAVALSGTLETFSLPDVLRLLSSTKKTGLLALDGDRGRGRIWVRDGAVVGADADRAVNEQLDGVAFELLRFADAAFEFRSGEEPSADGEPRAVDDVLAEAEHRLCEWREIEAVVPSLDVWVRMVAELHAERPVTPAQWRVLAQVGTGTSGHALADRLAAGEYDVCRQLRDLIVDGMVELDEAPARAAVEVEVAAPLAAVQDAPVWDDPIEEPTFVEPALAPEAFSSLGTDLASFVAVGTVDQPVGDTVDPADDPEPFPVALEPVPDDDADDDADADDDLLSQLSQLSPKAAAAVEATWSGEAPAEAHEAHDADAAVDDAPESDAPPAAAGDEIDQNLLLRFLSSTKH